MSTISKYQVERHFLITKEEFQDSPLMIEAFCSFAGSHIEFHKIDEPILFIRRADGCGLWSTRVRLGVGQFAPHT